MTIDEQITAIKARIDQARTNRIRAEANRENAQTNYDQAMAELTARYGVDNPEAVRDKLAELQTALQTKLAEVSSILDKNNS
jgi:outer membrane protein TolC